MQELLIFRINDSKDLDVYYKDRDMKEFVKITNVKYKSGLIKRINGDKSENLLLNNNTYIQIFSFIFKLLPITIYYRK